MDAAQIESHSWPPIELLIILGQTIIVLGVLAYHCLGSAELWQRYLTSTARSAVNKNRSPRQDIHAAVEEAKQFAQKFEALFGALDNELAEQRRLRRRIQRINRNILSLDE
ncbi:MAG: hypothetical protein Q9181_007800 [Wetmoreana brouardii]